MKILIAIQFFLLSTSSFSQKDTLDIKILKVNNFPNCGFSVFISKVIIEINGEKDSMYVYGKEK